MRRGFKQAWEELEIGEEITVSDGSPQPQRQGTPEWFAWRSHNFTGALAEKLDTTPRALRISFELSEEASIAYDVSEQLTHSFERVTPTLADLQTDKWDEVKAVRLAYQNGGVETPFGVADADASAKINVSGAVQMAMLAKQAGEPFSISWTMHDNSVALIPTADDMIAMGQLVGAHDAKCHSVSQSLREAIYNADSTADTVAEVDPAATYAAAFSPTAD